MTQGANKERMQAQVGIFKKLSIKIDEIEVVAPAFKELWENNNPPEIIEIELISKIERYREANAKKRA